MYFSVLPLLLLFASTIWASPTHIGRRMDTPSHLIIGGVALPPDKNDNPLCHKWLDSRRIPKEPIQGVAGASKMKYLDGIVVRVEVGDADVMTVTAMVEDTKHALDWGWSKALGARVAFFIQMPLEGEDTIKACLKTINWPMGLTDKERNSTYEKWHANPRKDKIPVEGGWFKMNSGAKEKKKALLRNAISVAETANVECMKKMKKMITDLETQGENGILVDWGWRPLPQFRAIGFVVEMRQEWKSTIHKYFGTIDAGDTGSH